MRQQTDFQQVREIIKQAWDRIDPVAGNYDTNGHSPLYGYGRLNAQKAAELGGPAQPSSVTIFTAVQDVPIKDFQASTLTLVIANTNPVKSLKVDLDI